MESRVFTYQEALQSFPEVRRLTDRAVRRIQVLRQAVAEEGESEQSRDRLEAETERIVSAWAAEVTALGCEVKGLWLVDWDSGDGYFCWRYPEQALSHFHGYEEGFSGRVPVV